MARYQVERILKDRFLTNEIAELPAMAVIVDDGEPTGTRARPRRRPVAEGRGPRPEPSRSRVRRAVRRAEEEAIVLTTGRPSLPIRSDSFEIPQADTWKARLYPTKSKLDSAIRSVGRIEVEQLGPYEGTGWMIAPGIVVTNRHVAEAFARRTGPGRFTFLKTSLGQRLATSIDFREEEFVARPFEVQVSGILYVAAHDDRVPDIAFLRVRPFPNDDRPLPPPIPLFDGPPKPFQVIAVIGYPARDPDVAHDLQARIFGSKFDIKRLAPGEVIADEGQGLFTHDASTLGGSSGSVVVDVATGAALGLHYAGDAGRANWAVSSEVLRQTLNRALRGADIRTLDPEEVTKPIPERVVKAGDLRDRGGYDPGFLGEGTKRVALPKLSASHVSRAARMPSKNGKPGSYVLPYQNFSVVVDRPRRMARYTAVNIDGAVVNRLKREREPWAFDPRIAKTAQLGNKLYAGNELDRGHLVRRLDPAWGPEARTAEMDTYFFTNCSPQVAHFNQTLWGDLEDYILDHADTENFRATVFTGPVLDDDRDPPYREAKLPGAYWKVVVMVRKDTKALSATGYLVSQSDLISGVEFVYGQFKTYQLPIRRVETLTRLKFGLSAFDPFVAEESVSSRELVALDDIQI